VSNGKMPSPRAEQFRLLVQGVVDYDICLLSPDGVVTTWNSGARRIKGYSAEEIIGRNFSAFYTDEARAQGEPAANLAAARSDGRVEREGWRVRKDGTQFWANVVIDAIHDADGTLVGFGKVTRDMSEARGAREALRESEQRFRMLVESVSDYAIFMLDPQGLVTNWNTGARRIKGYAADEIVGRHFSTFYTEEDRARGIPGRNLATAAREGRVEHEGWRVRKDGSRFWASVVISAIRDAGGELVGFAKVTRDMTEKRATDERMRQAQKMEALGQLTGGVAHDFNNMLAVIQGNLEALNRRLTEPDDAGLRRYVVSGLRGAERAAGLTHRLLAFARRQPLDPAPVTLNAVIAGMSDMFRRTLGEAILVETVLAAGLWGVLVDPNELESSLLNLAVNARDAMPDGGKLTIEAANVHLDEQYAADADVAPGQYVGLFVSDTGVGMGPETIARAFDPFFTTKEIGRGTGLGLSQVYGFIRQSGGHVKIYSELGSGTTVKLYLPRHISADDAVETAKARSAVPQGKGEAVLVVDDDSDVRRTAVEMLRELGYRTVEAPDGPTALRLLAAHRDIAILLTDIGLPGGMNGRLLADEAQRRHAGLRVLFTSGYPRNAIVHHGRLDPGVALLMKPFTYRDLAAKLRSILDGGFQAAPAGLAK
jgi:PAS domain S-box-containing protein